MRKDGEAFHSVAAETVEVDYAFLGGDLMFRFGIVREILLYFFKKGESVGDECGFKEIIVLVF